MQLIYSVVLTSIVQQNDSYVYIYIHSFYFAESFSCIY